MKSNLRVLYRTTLAKYSKFKSRYDKNLRSGHFQSLSDRKKSQIIARLKRLYNRICELNLQLKLAAATGVLALGLSATQPVTAQELGPFVQNDPKNPFFRTSISETDVKTTFGDLDFDGDLDMLTGNGAGTIRFFRNDGDASNARFIEQTFKYNPFYGVTTNNGHASPYLIDLDEDGDLDLILGARGTSGDYNVRYFENTDSDDAIFGNELSFTEITGASNPIDEVNGQYNNAHPALGDVDGDGDLDVLMGNSRGYTNGSYTGEALTLFRNNGGTDFTQEDAYSNLPGIPTFTYGDNDVSPTLFDLDGDGDLDLFVGNGDFGISGQIRFFENNDIDLPSDAILGDNISFTEQTGANNPFNGIDKGYNASVTFVDLDGDGDDDAVIGSNYGIYFFENEANVFTERNGRENPFRAFDFGYDVAPSAVDIDGDGFLDVVIGEKYSESLFLFQNNQDGTFSEQVGSTDNPFDDLLNTGDANTEYQRIDPDFADIDNDGDFDLFAAVRRRVYTPYSGEGQILFFRNSGSANNPVFVQEATPISITPDYNQIGITVGDFDNDSDFDVLLGGYNVNFGGSNFLFFNNVGDISTPNFNEIATNLPPVNSLDVGDNYLKPQFVDLDHDGDQDVVSGAHEDYLSGQLIFFRNINGNLIQQASFANPFDGFDVGYDSHPAFIDIDNDGDLDVLVGSSAGRITFLENTNVAPTITVSDPSSPFVEGGSSIALDPALSLTDDAPGEGDLITQARVSILNYVPGEDFLGFTPSTNPDANISGSFETSGIDAGTLILTGVDTIRNFEPVLQSIVYQNTSISPNTTPRQIRFEIWDWDNTNPIAEQVTVNITSVNSAPTASSSSDPNAIYTEDDTPGVLIDENFTVADVDNTTLASATVQITTNFQSLEDLLEFTDQNGITGSYDTTTGLLSLTGTASVANYQIALRSVRYSNSSQNPDNSDRTIRIRVNDGTANSNLATRTVIVVPVNDAPVVSSTNATTINYDQGTTAIIVDDLIDIVDVDHTQLVSASVSILGYQTGDILTGTAPTGTTLDFDTSTGVLTITGVANLADYITALSAITFSSDQSGTRQLSFVVNDGDDDSNIYLRDLNIISPNEAPVISSVNTATIDYEQNNPEVILDSQLSITDSDDTDLESLIISINGFVAGDTLTMTEPTGTTANFDSSSGILTISGTATVADYQTALQSLSFFSSNGVGSRVIEIIVNDGDDESNTFSIDIDISDEVITQPPVVNTTPSTTQVGSQVTIDLCDIISDPDNDFDELTITVVSISSGASTTIDECDLIIDYANTSFSGQDQILLRATDPDGNTDENTLLIDVEDTEEPGGDLTIYNAISPNGDGANDWWEIINLTTPNKIELYNRWGDLVKTLNNYENIENNTQLDDLAVGTYFYKISSPQGEYTGYITIKK